MQHAFEFAESTDERRSSSWQQEGRDSSASNLECRSSSRQTEHVTTIRLDDKKHDRCAAADILIDLPASQPAPLLLSHCIRSPFGWFAESRSFSHPRSFRPSIPYLLLFSCCLQHDVRPGRAAPAASPPPPRWYRLGSRTRKASMRCSCSYRDLDRLCERCLH